MCEKQNKEQPKLVMERERRLKKEDAIKIINHPNAKNVDSGDVSDAIRKWCRQKKDYRKEDQQL